MTFLAYSEAGKPITVRYSKDESGQSLRTVTTSRPPIGESPTREGIAEIAYACLGRDPAERIYITDSQNRLLEIIISEKYHQSVGEGAGPFMPWALLFLCVVCFVGTILNELHWGGLGILVLISLLYIVLVCLRIQREVESAVICTVILLLTLALVPEVTKVWKLRAQLPTPAIETHAPGAEEGKLKRGK
jgi:hypothetical protein